jgi:acetyl esterase/lipase
VASWQMTAVGLVLRATRKRAYATAARGRRRIAAPVVEAPPPRRLTERHDVRCRTLGGFPVWTVRPRTGSGRAALYLHGGAYISGIAPQHWTLIGRLADAGVRVEVPLYGAGAAVHLPGRLSLRARRVPAAGGRGPAAGDRPRR